MSFDALAPHYRWMEFVLARERLQRCRTAFLGKIRTARRVLIAGEGNGRFLAECAGVVSGAKITCVDSSSAMLAQARRRAGNGHAGTNEIEFIHADILNWTPPDAAYDAVVTHFFLDCFRADQLDRIVPMLAQKVVSGGHWLIADFQKPVAGWRRARAAAILQMMYVFFRFATALPARSLTPPDALLLRAGFSLEARIEREWGLLHSDCWRNGR